MKARTVSTFIAIGLLAGLCLQAQGADVDDLTPVQTFTPSDFPPGVFAAAPNPWNAAVVAYGPWVYAACGPTRHILQFSRDKATAKLSYVGAIAYTNSARAIALEGFYVRPHNGKPTLYYQICGDEAHTTYWWSIAMATGTLREPGQQGLKSVPFGRDPLPRYPNWYYASKDGVNGGTFWIGYGPDGALVEKGRISSRNACDQVNFIVSHDGKNLYRFCNKALLEIYKIDTATGSPTLDTTMDLAALLIRNEGNGAFDIVDMPPDDRHVYLFQGNWNKASPKIYCVLTRDPSTGRLAVPSQCNAMDAKLDGLSSNHWNNLSRIVYNRDGKSGYFITERDCFGTFNRDPASGAITVSATRSSKSVGAHRIFYDAEYGNLYTIGSKICAFQTSAPGAGNTPRQR